MTVKRWLSINVTWVGSSWLVAKGYPAGSMILVSMCFYGHGWDIYDEIAMHMRLRNTIYNDLGFYTMYY